MLNAKTFDLLVILVENRDRIVTKDELLEKVWAEQFVEENNLTVQIFTLRKVLGESKDEPQFFTNIPRKGYKFIASVQVSDGEISNNRHQTVAEKLSTEKTTFFAKLKNSYYLIALAFILLTAVFFYFANFSKSHKTIESIAVLPLVNVGDNSKTDYLSDGITENLINDLSQSSNLKVIARSSVFQYKVNEAQSSQLDFHSIADKLGVQAILTGRVEQRGDDLLISVELIDGNNNTNIWGEHYNRKFADVFIVQEEIAKDISDKLRLKLTGGENREIAKRYTDNIKAFENYTMGRAYIHRRTREDLLTSVRYYEQAIKEDQDYALAYAGLAEAYGNLGARSYISPAEGRQKLKEAASKSISLDANLAEAHVMMGYYFMGFAPYNFADGDRELRTAIELSPSLAIAHLYLSLSLFRQGRLDEGLAEMLRARELDPFSAVIAHQLSLHYILKRDFVRALELLKQADEIGPPFTITTEVSAYIYTRSFEIALAKIEKEKQQRKGDPILIYSEGMIYAAQKKRAEALKIIDELKRLSESDFRQALWIAKIYCLLGEKEEALKWLENGLQSGALAAFYKNEPVWDLIHNDGRFTDLTKRMGV